MPKLSDAFPSNYLKADVDIPEEGIDLVIKDAVMETIGTDRKLVLTFRGEDKGLVCNKTNAAVIEKLTKSDDTDDWIGQAITLYATDVEFKGEMTRGIRVKTRKPAPKVKVVAKPNANPEAMNDEEDASFDPSTY